MWNAFQDYIDHCLKTKIQVIVQGGKNAGEIKPFHSKIPHFLEFWCIWCGHSRSTWTETYLNDKNFSETCKKIQDSIYAIKKTSIINGIGNTPGLMHDLKVNHGENEKMQAEISIPGVTINLIPKK